MAKVKCKYVQFLRVEKCCHARAIVKEFLDSPTYEKWIQNYTTQKITDPSNRRMGSVRHKTMERWVAINGFNSRFEKNSVRAFVF